MPYTLSIKGIVQLRRQKLHLTSVIPNLTELQRMALSYLQEHRSTNFISTSEIATNYGLAPQAMRGVLWSLYKRGLVDKKE